MPVPKAGPNPYHLQILRGGPDRWNEWRLENPDIGPDVRWANLAYEELQGVARIVF
jgi:hypothetical protein